MIGSGPLKFWVFNFFLFAFSILTEAQPIHYKKLDEALLNKTQVLHLTIKKAEITRLDESLPQFPDLQTLDLGGTRLQKFPAAICNVLSIKELKLGNNEIDTLPDCVCRLVNLERIELWDNNIYYLPECLNSLPNLKTLDLTGVKYNREEHAKLLLRFPNFKLILSEACDCNFE